MMNALPLVALAAVCLLVGAQALPSTFTVEDLKKYDGTNGRPILLAIKGVVYDVSEGRKFYGPEGPYHVLAGKDCTRAIAFWSLEESDMHGNISDFTDEQHKSLDEIIKNVYEAKYPAVGRLVEPHEDL